MIIVLITGESGSGKSTIVNTLHHKYPDLYNIIKSYTTRKQRNNNDTDHTFINSKDDISNQTLIAETMIDDGFCMQHCYYTEGAYYCPKWTDKAIDFDYNRVYRLCQQYIDICHMFEEHEKLKEKNPDKYLSMSNLFFFLNCCCNDLAREFSLYKMRK